MSLKTRLDRLERHTGARNGHCPGCGLRPQDVRTIEICPTEAPRDAPEPPFPDPPGRERCPVYGLWATFLYLYQDGTFEEPRRGRGGVRTGRWDQPAAAGGADR